MYKQQSLPVIMVGLLILLSTTALYAQGYNNIKISPVEDPFNAFDQNTTAIAISPVNPNLILIGYNDDTGHRYITEPGYAFSTDGGGSWIRGLFLYEGSNLFGEQPSVAFDHLSNAFYCHTFAEVLFQVHSVRVSRTTNLGITWDHVPVTSVQAMHDVPKIAVSGNSVYVSWTEIFTLSGSQRQFSIKFAYSNDYGASYCPQITLDSQISDYSDAAYYGLIEEPTPGVAGSHVNGSFPMIGPMEGPDLVVYVLWYKLEHDGYSGGAYWIRKLVFKPTGEMISEPPLSEDPRRVVRFTWLRGGPNAVLGFTDVNNLPSMAMDSHGNIYVFYLDQVSETDITARPKMARLMDGSVNWDSLGVIVDMEGFYAHPWVAVDADGRIAITFMYTSDTDPSNGVLIDNYMSESFDQGQTFRQPVRITTQSSYPESAGNLSIYQGMLTGNNYINYVAWTDYRNALVGHKNQDVYFAKVNLPSSAPQNLSISIVNPVRNPRLDWVSINNEPDFDRYKIYRKEGPGNFLQIATTQNMYFIDTQIQNANLHPFLGSNPIYYKVTAIDIGNQESEFSNTVSANIPGGSDPHRSFNLRHTNQK